MCGIIGAYRTSITEGLKAIAHRGPDGLREQFAGDWHLGHALLAIIDPGPMNQQPLRWGPVTVILNGEIWNHEMLRTRLVDEGCVFTTKGDAEILAALFARYGVDCFRMLEGMFAAALYDDREGTLTLVRDRFGEIPLHYLPIPPFTFASEMKAIKALDMAPQETRRLQPGYYATCDGVHITLSQYSHVRCRDGMTADLDPAKVIRSLLSEGVKERLIGKGPMCLALSGGIDSTAIALLLKQHIADLEAYIAVYDPLSGDLAAARRAAAHLGIRLHEVIIPEPGRQELEEIIRIIEMPHKAQVEIAWPCFFLGKRMQEDGFRIVFSGDGSDELWASYRFAQKKLSDGKDDWHSYRVKLLLKQENKNFARGNKIYMHHGIEPRLPFLHQSLVEYALSLDELSVEGPDRKPKDILYRSFRDLLPEDLAAREKMSFQRGVGLEPYLRGTFGDTRGMYLDSYKKLYGAAS